jgi:hypothetical protein
LKTEAGTSPARASAGVITCRLALGKLALGGWLSDGAQQGFERIGGAIQRPMPVVPQRLRSLRSRKEHADANRQLVRCVRGAGARTAKVRLHEGRFVSYYVEPLDIWLVAHGLPNRYRNAFGPGDPRGRGNLWPSIQFNLARAPGSATPRARFLRDDRGQLWLAHSGTLGGRQAGISRDGFLQVLGGTATVLVDEVARELVVLGTFARPQLLLEEIARLTHAASAYRGALAAGLTLR